ncbi:MAG: CHRD domain-containing protein [Phycisphaerae bacterium]
MRFTSAAAVAIGIGLGASPALAAVVTFNVNMTGQKEVTAGGTPNQGDLNGSAIGTATLNSDTNTISWNLVLSGLATPPVTDFHIHTGGPATTGGVLIPLGIPGGSTLTQTSFIGSVTVTGGDITDLQNVLANTAGFYFNIHNNEFSGGAVRDQVPEPGTLGMLAGAGLLALTRRRRRAA